MILSNLITPVVHKLELNIVRTKG